MTKITFWALRKVQSQTDLWVTTVWKKFTCEVDIKCHQSCSVALVFCTKFYRNLAFSLGLFSQFSCPINFWADKALILNFGKIPLNSLFSNTLFANFDIFFRSGDICRFAPKNRPIWTWGQLFKHKSISWRAGHKDFSHTKWATNKKFCSKTFHRLRLFQFATSKANLNNPGQGFLVRGLFLPRKEKESLYQSRFQLKSVRIRSIFCPFLPL